MSRDHSQSTLTSDGPFAGAAHGRTRKGFFRFASMMEETL